jgi:hypothetical protein
MERQIKQQYKRSSIGDASHGDVSKSNVTSRRMKDDVTHDMSPASTARSQRVSPLPDLSVCPVWTDDTLYSIRGWDLVERSERCARIPKITVSNPSGGSE